MRLRPRELVGPRRLQTMADVGALLLGERRRRALNQTEMAAMLGVTRQKLALIEAGQTGVAAQTVLRLLSDLGVLVLAVPPTAPEARELADRILTLWDRVP